MRGLNWVIVVVGILTIIAPFVFGFSAIATPYISNLIVGVLFVIFGLVTALSGNLGTDRTLDWIVAVLGLWLIISPFILGLTTMVAAQWSNVVLGLIALVFGVWAAMTERQATV